MDNRCGRVGINCFCLEGQWVPWIWFTSDLLILPGSAGSGGCDDCCLPRAAKRAVDHWALRIHAAIHLTLVSWDENCGPVVVVQNGCLVVPVHGCQPDEKCYTCLAFVMAGIGVLSPGRLEHVCGTTPTDFTSLVICIF